MLDIGKETLISVLEEAVDEANRQDPNALGIVLFGSRARGTHRPDSDVDLMNVARNRSDGHFTYYPIYTNDRLSKSVKEKLYTLAPDLMVHSCGCLVLTELLRANQGVLDEFMFEELARSCKPLLHNSRLVISKDNSISLAINQFQQTMTRKWIKDGCPLVL